MVCLSLCAHSYLSTTPRRITLPCLNLYGTDSGCFPPGGCEAVGTLIPNCRNVAFEGLNHWLYLEDPARFNQLVGPFALEKSR